jgi:hypothetical protein
MAVRTNVLSLKKLVLAFTVFAVFGQPTEVRVTLNRAGANIGLARVRPAGRVIWSSASNNWRAEFKGRTPCQNGKRIFSSTESGTARICTISVTCTNADRSGCGRYKYDSSADGGPVIDPEIEVEPGN